MPKFASNSVKFRGYSSTTPHTTYWGYLSQADTHLALLLMLSLSLAGNWWQYGITKSSERKLKEYVSATKSVQSKQALLLKELNENWSKACHSAANEDPDRVQFCEALERVPFDDLRQY